MCGDTAALEGVVKGQWRGAVAEAWGNGQTPGRVVANVACALTATSLTCRCCACEPQGHADRGGAQRSSAWRMVEARKHAQSQHTLPARAHNANGCREEGNQRRTAQKPVFPWNKQPACRAVLGMTSGKPRLKLLLHLGFTARDRIARSLARVAGDVLLRTRPFRASTRHTRPRARRAWEQLVAHWAWAHAGARACREHTRRAAARRHGRTRTYDVGLQRRGKPARPR